MHVMGMVYPVKSKIGGQLSFIDRLCITFGEMFTNLNTKRTVNVSLEIKMIKSMSDYISVT